MATTNSEEAAEFVMTVRTDHVPMKEWYNNAASGATRDLHNKYGPYPGLWKEVLNWPGWKEARKEYLRDQQRRESGASNGGDEKPAIPRKRKSRWGSKGTEPPPSSQPPLPNGNAGPPPLQNGGGGGGYPNKRMHTSLPSLVLPGIHADNLTPQQRDELRDMQSQLRRINDRLDGLEQEAARVDSLPRGHRDRSPSPPPIYGADGKRRNTRAVRWRERYTAERQDLLERIMRLSRKSSGGAVGRASTLLVRKRVKKIRIPVDEHPNYNFIGLIIGPRGKTQKELEAKTGCKIAIRGRGSVKEGARGRRDGKVMEGDNEPLHVVISGDDQKAVDAASDMIEQMLVVIDDEKNVHKQQQLRELALLNGTLKEEEFCQICGEKGHRSFECPKRFGMSKNTVAVKCAICGDTSHPTRDCTQKPTDVNNQQQIDSEYLSFMAELDGKRVEKPAAAANGNNIKQEPQTAKPPGHQSGGNPPPPPPPTGLPPPPAAGPGTAPAGVPPPGPQAPPPPHQQYPGYGQNQHGHGAHSQGGYQQGHGGQYYGSYGHHGQHHQQQQHHNHAAAGYGQSHQQQGQYPQHQQPVQVKPGEETAGWDPSSWYGAYANAGAGGFNWWEQ